MLILNVNGILFFAVKVKPLYISRKVCQLRMDHSIVEAMVGQKDQKKLCTGIECI